MTAGRLALGGFLAVVAVMLVFTFRLQGGAAVVPGEVTDAPDVVFTLTTSTSGGGMRFVGQGGEIDGQTNPALRVAKGAVVQVNLVNDDGAAPDIAVPALGARSALVARKGAAVSVVFRADKEGEHEYICTLPGHAAAGMKGVLAVAAPSGDDEARLAEVAQDPTRVGKPVGRREGRAITFTLETTERLGRLDSGASYRYWTFNGTVPGPFLRARVGDTITVNLSNPASSQHIHSVDFHAVTGPGGGATFTQAAPGQTKSFTFTALKPGLFVYHCATPMVSQHITNGMYGLILIEPEGGLPHVDREFYIMQAELYTHHPRGHHGEQALSVDKLLDEAPEYFTFNGTVNALTETHRMEAEVGDTVRIYFGVGGPNAASSFHVIGEIFDRVYDQASLTRPPLTDVQTALVAPGGASVVEFKVDYPGRYLLVDHALSRVEKGLLGYLHVKGEADPKVFRSSEIPDSGH
ncbi:MAG: copper-containing nitrite reductase [Thiohalomonadaceae bacterium]